MNSEDSLKQNIQKALQKLDILVELNDIIIEKSKEKAHGDYACNVAMKMASKLHDNPRNIANKIIANLDMQDIEKIEIAGPGFMNFFVKSDLLTKVIDDILTKKEHYGDGEKKDITYNIEYVSANPTGDLHLGHARGAAIGDSLSRIYKKAGYNVVREFYVNDAGAQMNNLSKSLKSRYFDLFGKDYPLPEDGYHGEDVKIIAKELKDEFGDKYLQEDDSNLPFFKEYGMDKELAKLQKDLKEFRVEFDKFSLETDIRKGSAISDLLAKMKNDIYVQDGATFLRTSEFLDDKDRPIIKSNGDFTYFLPDIAYHLNKLSRADHLVDVLGADHHGYINRMKSALMINGYKPDDLEVELIQMVRIIKDGEEVKMSKRTGNAIKMRELISLVGIDSVRYFFVERAASSHLDFDLDLALAQSSNNPVFYAQYAYARICKILSKATTPLNNNYYLLSNENELSLMKLLMEYGKIIQDAFKERAPYKVCNYIQTLAGQIHGYYASTDIIKGDESPEVIGARLSLISACKIVLANALELIGVSTPEKM